MTTGAGDPCVAPGTPPAPPVLMERYVLHAMREGVVVTTRDGHVVFANRAAEEILGLTLAQLTDRDAADSRWDAVTRDGSLVQPAALPSARTWRTGEEVVLAPVGIRRSDGSTRWLEVTTTLLPGGAGLISTFDDTTDREEAGQALRLAEERFRRTFDFGPIGKALVGIDGSLLRVNRKLCEFLGYTQSELLARTFQQITHLDDQDADTTLLRELLAGDRNGYEVEKRYVRRNGDEVWALLSVALVRDEAGTPLHVVAQLQDISQRKRFEDDLAHMADHDVLTGLRNRRRFEIDLTSELARIARSGAEASLAMLDLDHFKEINDSLGHRAGDELLRHVATLLADRLRRTDVLARLGGDEFAILLPDTALDQAEMVVNELVERVATTPLQVGYEKDEVRITVSAGVTPISDAHVSADEAMVAADLAMYEAKHAGRNAVHVRSADDHPEERERERLEWSQRIRRALDGDGFELRYQPIADLRRGTVDMFEALLRIDGGPGRPLVMPGRFLYIAARHGLLPAIDRWVIAQAIHELGTGALGPTASVSINVSGMSLGDSRLADLFEERLRIEGVDPTRVQFEITETTAIASLEHAELFCRRIHRLGSRLALDDFGSGFASFLNLKRLPYDTIKVDGEFVRSAARGPQERLLIEALLDVGRKLEKQTVAEHVEDEATHDLLLGLGADAAQGYFVGRPGPAPDALAAAVAYGAAQLLRREAVGSGG